MKKISTEDQVIEIKEGDRIRKYPTSGEPMKDIDQSSFENSTDYEVKNVFSADFYNPEFELEVIYPASDNLKLRPGPPSDINATRRKRGNDFIDEQVWWWSKKFTLDQIKSFAISNGLARNLNAGDFIVTGRSELSDIKGIFQQENIDCIATDYPMDIVVITIV